MELKVKNKWNGRFYTVVDDSGKEVTLVREDGSRFTIQKAEYQQCYFEVKNKK